MDMNVLDVSASASCLPIDSISTDEHTFVGNNNNNNIARLTLSRAHHIHRLHGNCLGQVFPTTSFVVALFFKPQSSLSQSDLMKGMCERCSFPNQFEMS